MEMTRISVPMPVEEREALIASAQRSLRHPRDHARYLLRLALGFTEDQQVESTEHAKSGTTVRQDLVSATL